MRKFEEGDFVHQATNGNKVMLIASVDRRAPASISQMDRFTLQGIDGVRFANIGAYELTHASDEEVETALKETDSAVQPSN